MSASATVLVCFARPDPLAAEADALGPERWLDAADLAHVARFRFERDRRVALGSRVLQRLAIAAFDPALRLEPQGLRFAAEAGGPPAVVAPDAGRSLQFNVSNTLGLVGCAVMRGGQPGLDVEPRRDSLPEELLERYFTPAERRALAALPRAQQPDRFVRLWTLKEAYLKARGIGLDAPLQRFGFHFEHDPEAPELQDLDDVAAASRWRFLLPDAGPSLYAALCLPRDREYVLDVRWLQPDIAAARFAPGPV